MKEKKWIALDNASKIFVSTISKVDSKCYRISISLEENIDYELLKKAVNRAYDRSPLFHYSLERGLFWDYLLETDERPEVEYDKEVPCAPLYPSYKRKLLFTVSYYKNKINLNAFHVLSDGTGAIWFLMAVVEEYLKGAYPHISLNKSQDLKRESRLEDAFSYYFDRGSDRLKEMGSIESSPIKEARSLGKSLIKPKGTKKIFRIRGNYNEDYRINFLQMDLASSKVHRKSKELKVSMTSYLIGVFIKSAIDSDPYSSKDKLITISVPVNLRNIFPSETQRNFFYAMTLAYYFDGGEVSIERIAKSINKQMFIKLRRENLIRELRKLKKLEENLLIRVLILPLKDLILKIAGHISDRGHSLAMTNLSRIEPQEDLKPHIKSMAIHSSSIRPQFTMVTLKDVLSIVYQTPYKDRNLERAFYQNLKDEGFDIKIDRDYPSIPVKNPKNAVYKFGILGSFLIFLVSIILHYSLGKNLLPLRLGALSIISLWSISWAVIRRNQSVISTLFRSDWVLILIFLTWDVLTGFRAWSLDFALPITALFFLVLITIVQAVLKRPIEESGWFILATNILALIPGLLFFLSLINVKFPSLLSSITAIILLVIFLLRHRKEISDLIKSRTHL